MSEKIVTSKKSQRTERSVYLFIDSALSIWKGEWSWDLHTDQVFCSDVILSSPASFAGTRGIIHPDDLLQLKSVLPRENIENVEFRMITTFGEVKNIRGKHVHAGEPDPVEIIQGPENAIAAAEMIAQARELSLKKLGYEYLETAGRSGTWLINRSTNETWYSDAVYRLHGIQPQTLNPHPYTFHSFIHPDDLIQVSEFFDKALLLQLPLHMEYRIIRPDGTEKRLMSMSTWTHSQTGESVYFGWLQDVTEQRETELDKEQAERQVDFSKQLLQLAENTTNLGYWHLNLVTRKMVYSEYCYRIFGIKPQNLISGSGIFQTYVHPEDQELYAVFIDKIRWQQQVPETEFRIVRPDGKLRYVRQKGRTLVSGGDTIVSGIIQDITSQKLMEAEIRQLEKKLLVATARTSQKEAMAGLGTWLWNLATGEMEWSDNLLDLLGYKPNTFKGTDKLFIRSIHPDDQKAFRQQVDLVIANKEDRDFRFRLVKKTGLRHFRAFFRILTHEGEDLFIATFQDITAEYSGQIELNERIQLVETLSDSIPDIVLVTNTDNSIIHWNLRCEQVYSRRKEEVLGENFFDVFPHLKQDQIIHDVNTALQGQKVEHQEYTTSRYAKGVFNVKLIPLKDEEDRVIGVLHMLHDITREHHLHHELTSRLQFIERLLEATVDRIIVLDRNMNYLYWNKRAEDHYGISKDEVVGKNILEIFPGFMNDPSYKEFRNVLRGEIVHIPAEKNLQSKKGYFETYLIPVKTKEGMVSSILWIVHDLYKEYQLQRQTLKEREVLDALNENYLELDSDYHVTYINHKGEEFLGKSKEELIGVTIWDVFPEVSMPAVRNAMRKAMEEGISTRQEYMSASSGSWINISIAPTIDGIVMLFFDIQHIKESQEKLRKEHSRLQEAQSIGHIGSFEWDAATDQIYWSAEMYRINGMDPGTGSLTLDHVLARVHPDDVEKVRELIITARKEPGTYELVHRLLLPEGKIKTVDRRVRSFSDGRGQVTFISGTMQDISERIESEEKLREIQRKLQQTAVASPDAITIYDVVNKHPEYINDNLANWIGYTSEDLVNMGYKGRVLLIHPDDRPRLLNFNWGIGNITDTDIRTIEYRLLTTDGGIIWVRNRSKIFQRNSKGEVTHILSVLQEITQEKVAKDEMGQLNRSLEQRNRELQQKNQEIGLFAQVASHDLKEPLRKIQTYASMLIQQESDKLSTDGKTNLDHIANSVKKMETLVEDILVLARRNAGHAAPGEGSDEIPVGKA